MRLKLTSMHHATAPTNASSSGYYNDNDNIAEQYTLTMLAAHTNTWQGDNQLFSIFYRAVLATGLCLSVSVTSQSSTKTAKRRITQTTPHDTPGTLVF